MFGIETEKRLIDKQTAIELLRGKCVSKYPSTFVMGLFAAADEIEKIPEVDAAEVVHGYWKSAVDTNTPMHECSVCGARVVKGLYEHENPNLFCYHCGAKMDKDNLPSGDE